MLGTHSFDISITSKQIMLLDDQGAFCRSCRRVLRHAGFQRFGAFQRCDELMALLRDGVPDLLLVDIRLGEDQPDGLDFLRSLRARGFERLAVAFSADSSPGAFHRAVVAGADDYLVKEPDLDLPREVEFILTRPVRLRDLGWDPEIIRHLAYFHSFGLTPREIDLLADWARDFCSLKVLARRVALSYGYVKQLFESIRDKMRVDTNHQLAARLAMCGFIRK